MLFLRVVLALTLALPRCVLSFAPFPRVTPLDIVSSGFASIARIKFAPGTATTVADEVAARPEASAKTALTLYDVESDAECRRVREAVTRLDLVLDVLPCGIGSRHLAEAAAAGGSETVPLLVDGASGAAIYGAAEITAYLERYAGATLEFAPPSPLVDAAAHAATTALRGGRGVAVLGGAPAMAPPQRLVLWSYEGNQFCRCVREVRPHLMLHAQRSVVLT